MQHKKEDKICHMCVCVWLKKTGKCLVDFWIILCVCCHIYLVSSHLVVNIYLFIYLSGGGGVMMKSKSYDFFPYVIRTSFECFEGRTWSHFGL